ncbi:MAG: chemotaxis protein CheB [Cyanobacteriota bacterium]|jgi:two-component system CheB/CheR fusion protein
MTSNLEHVLAIGASAGGLKALQDLLGQFSPGTDVAVVVAQHLAPDHSTQLVPLLGRATQLRVKPASDGQPLQHGDVLVVPPNCDATIELGCLKLAAPAPRFGPSPSIDLLFESLASDCGERAVAVVLSGTGSDGACGLRAVGASGGLTLVQSPASALFDGMPRAAISLGSPDLVADPQTIGARLAEWFASGGSWNQGTPEAQPLLLASAAARLKQATGIDFSQYKETTLLRQIQRRMAVNNMPTMESYLKLLNSDVSEARTLTQNLLVTVTSFFRNPEGFNALATQLKLLIGQLGAAETLRIWVPGCATGEEAYSIGMLVSEAMGHPKQLAQVVKIFATDLDEQSLTIARKASYPISAAKSIPDDLRKRFILEKESEFEIVKDLRSCIIFARHNVGEDPPFPDIHLISCRNLLIYFTPALQERVIDLFSFSLRPGSLLFLGSSESLAQLSGFRVLEPVHRLYGRTQQVRSRVRLASLLGQRKNNQERPSLALSSERESAPTQHIQLLDALIRVFAKPCLVLDENHTLVEVIGDVSSFCKLPEGRITGAAVNFLREELQSEARALFLLARAGRVPVRSNRLSLPNLPSPLRMEAAPIQVGDAALTVLSFHEESEGEALKEPLENSDRNTVFALEIERLEHELLTSQDSLRRSLIHLEQANEELEASSEELQASSEELQSSNEELEASNEELQATNDELALLNQQLRVRSDEFEHLNTDLENIQRSLNQGMVIVDKQLRIARFSPLAVRVFGLVAGDIGQSLMGIPTTMPIPGLRDSLLAVLDGGERSTLQATSDDLSYLLQLMPYQNDQGETLGAIITLTDVSELEALRRAAETSLHEFLCLAEALDQAVWKRDHTLEKILFISARIEALTGWTPTEVCAQPECLDQAILTSDRDSVMASRQAGIAQSGWEITYQIQRRDGKVRSVREVAVVVGETSDDGSVFGTLTDVTDQQATLSQKHFLGGAFHTLMQSDAHPIALLDASLRIVAFNEHFARCFSPASYDFQGKTVDDLSRLLILLDQASPSAALPSTDDLRAVAQQAIESGQPSLQHPAMFLQADLRHSPLSIDVLPIKGLADQAGLLLKLHIDP